jgi:hypothetical protein
MTHMRHGRDGYRRLAGRLIVLPKGTPVAQCVPVRREFWSARFETIAGEAVGRLQATAAAVTSERGVYRRQFRAPKR